MFHLFTYLTVYCLITFFIVAEVDCWPLAQRKSWLYSDCFNFIPSIAMVPATCFANFIASFFKISTFLVVLYQKSSYDTTNFSSFSIGPEGMSFFDIIPHKPHHLLRLWFGCLRNKIPLLLKHHHVFKPQHYRKQMDYGALLTSFPQTIFVQYPDGGIGIPYSLQLCSSLA